MRVLYSNGIIEYFKSSKKKRQRALVRCKLCGKCYEVYLDFHVGEDQTVVKSSCKESCRKQIVDHSIKLLEN